MDSIKNYNYPTLPNEKTNILSLITIFLYIIGLVVGGYAVSISKNQIEENEFTVSQSLAFGSKEIMIICFVISYLCGILLIWERGPMKYIVIRSLFVTISYILLITIIYVTVYYDKYLHYTFAGIIFVCNLLFIFLTAHLFRGYLRQEPVAYTYLFDGLLIILLASFIMVNVYGVFKVDTETFIDDEIFATSELTSVFCTLGVIYYLGFQ